MTQDKIKERIVKLYGKYLAGEISRLEYDELFDYLKDETHRSWMADLVEDSLPGNQKLNGTRVRDVGNLHTSGTNRYNWSRRKFLYAISAAATVLVLIAAVFFLYPSKPAQWVIHTTGNQETRTIDLPDGSVVELNANSELKYLEDFGEASERIVHFRGEGYFDVAHSNNQIFKVQTASVDVNVLGTEFNLETRRDYTNVFLKEGKVVLETEDEQSVEMEPGDLVRYDNGKREIRKVSDQPSVSALSWKDGVFTFLELTGIQILEKMEDIYGKEFEIENPRQLRDVIVVQGLPYTDWDFTKEALELALNIQIIASADNEYIVKEK